ncbi:hypothetical protein MU752_32350, partial [Pseudomonas aeruginosa]|uniref:hypothetical protein n=1 Tax=Pseudomonas aeruginosa TaxID=287 RepID=UPI0024BE3425
WSEERDREGLRKWLGGGDVEGVVKVEVEKGWVEGVGEKGGVMGGGKRKGGGVGGWGVGWW